MHPVERLIERTIVASRWLLVVFYLGLVAALLLYAVAFLAKFRYLAENIFALSPTDTILAMLGLIPGQFAVDSLGIPLSG